MKVKRPCIHHNEKQTRRPQQGLTKTGRDTEALGWAQSFKKIVCDINKVMEIKAVLK
jgi:hypothetical protein